MPAPPDRSARVTAPLPSYVQVATRLRTQILSGELKPEQRLPPESDLAAALGVSRSTAREALRLLAAEGLIETRRGVTGGSFVAHPEPHELETAMGRTVDRMLAASSLSLEEVIEVWNALEIAAAARAAASATPRHVQQLLELSKPMPTRMPIAAVMVQTTGFHTALIEASGNRMLPMLLQPLSHLARDEMMPTRDLRGFLGRANDEHRRVAEAIAAGDVWTTVELMTAHMAPRAARHA